LPRLLRYRPAQDSTASQSGAAPPQVLTGESAPTKRGHTARRFLSSHALPRRLPTKETIEAAEKILGPSAKIPPSPADLDKLRATHDSVVPRYRAAAAAMQ
jgi:hypothetical protein